MSASQKHANFVRKTINHELTITAEGIGKNETASGLRLPVNIPLINSGQKQICYQYLNNWCKKNL